jgi:hypothetical protein
MSNYENSDGTPNRIPEITHLDHTYHKGQTLSLGNENRIKDFTIEEIYDNGQMRLTLAEDVKSIWLSVEELDRMRLIGDVINQRKKIEHLVLPFKGLRDEELDQAFGHSAGGEMTREAAQK